MANTGQDGCIIFSHPANFGVFSSGVAFSTVCVSGASVAPAILAVVVTPAAAESMGLFFFLRERHSPKNLIISEGQIEFDFFPQFLDALCQKAKRVLLFCKILQGPGVHNCLLPEILPDVLGSIDRYDQRHKPLAVQTWWCWGCLKGGLLGF